jgi:hypothetical protein
MPSCAGFAAGIMWPLGEFTMSGIGRGGITGIIGIRRIA